MKKFLTTVSVLTLFTSSVVLADEMKDKQAEATKQNEENFQELTSFIFGTESEELEITKMQFDVDLKAENIIGKPVYNLDERIGTVHDIILDKEGNAVMAVIADGELFGLGKLVAVEYSRLAEHQVFDSYLMSISEDTIDQIVEFSYDRNDSSSDTQVIPQNAYSLKELLDSELTNKNGVPVAEVDDVYLDQGKASHLIVDFDELYYDETVAVEFNIAEITHDNDEYNFQLLSPSEVKLDNYRKLYR